MHLILSPLVGDIIYCIIISGKTYILLTQNLLTHFLSSQLVLMSHSVGRLIHGVVGLLHFTSSESPKDVLTCFDGSFEVPRGKG